MNQLVLASTEADAAAATAVEQHHAQLVGALATLVEALLAAASSGDSGAATDTKDRLLTWCERELVPHALAEEEALYPAARAKAEGRLLIEGMLVEHDVIRSLLKELSDGTDAIRIAATAASLEAVFEAHLVKENELVLPLLVAAPDVSVADLLGEMHELLGEVKDDAGHEHGHCACGEVDGPGFPELDARVVPHRIRHATVFGALDTVETGGGLILIAPHDPLPLLAQIDKRAPGRFQVDYLERGPEAWRLSFRRVIAG